ncbi:MULTISPECIES: S9 family peptidase [unclassified Streptomyces]|uniref:alpha/beta hydrolase family protein n=1 Tax=unclassified Streptomyces TaxID=2593676 RepID=UPI00035E583A|nr:alpha/beta hydrolase [Streptomyces sp. KhCrAH-43]MYS35033.1 alpha/beta hydrolase [Streptomyces sp. SID4920]MYX65190.1 alpha/beta hydrolase [Streptomyces sp. SID8373]
MNMNSNARNSPRQHGSRRLVAAATAVVLAALGAAPATAASRPATGHDAPSAAGRHEARGTLLAVTPVARLDRAEVAAHLADAGIHADTVRHGIRGYRLTYTTITPQGRPTTATGLLVLPEGGRHRLDLVSDTHGTMAHRDYAPSVGEDFGRYAPYLHASAGRAVAAPDYLGLGKGPGRHPYMDTTSAVSASLDMLRASRTAALRLDRPLTGDVYASGFSQGGQVAMALGKALQGGADRHFRLRALAPVSGPYDIEHAESPALFDGRVSDTSGLFYMTYFLTAQNRLHPLWKDPSEAFREPYAGLVDGLFDSDHYEEEIIGALPANLRELLTDAYYRELQHPTGALLAAFRAQDGTCVWKPAVPVRLYSSSGDTDVPIANARHCAADLAHRGVRAPVVDQGDMSHNETYLTSGPQIVRWFDGLGARR